MDSIIVERQDNGVYLSLDLSGLPLYAEGETLAEALHSLAEQIQFFEE